MSTKKRWDFMNDLKPADEAAETPPAHTTEAPGLMPSNITHEGLRSVPKRQGRAEQKEQLNIRIPRELKRLAQAQAALEGRNIGDLIEQLLIDYVVTASNKPK